MSTSISRLTLRKKVAELLIVRASGHLLDTQRNYPKWELNNNDLKALLLEGVGGVILVGGSIIELHTRCRLIKEWACNPLLICADIEEGLGQRFSGGTSLVPPMALSKIGDRNFELAIQLAKKYGECIAEQARICGLNWVLAPVCDVNINEANPVINVRAWGDNPTTVSALASAFNKGLTSYGILSCAKHFPGHGDTSVDSHLELPLLNRDLSSLKELELIPFQTLINEGVSSVMTAHLLIPELDPIHPVSLSKQAIEILLRRKLGFEGLIVTDALVMDAISKNYGPAEAAIMAIDAGVDLLLMPEKPLQVLDALCEAFQSGRLSMDRLDQALTRRANALQKVQSSYELSNTKTFSFFSEEFEKDRHRMLSHELIIKSLDTRNIGNIKFAENGVNLIRTDSLLQSSILTHNSPSIVLPESVGYKTLICHQLGVKPWQDDLHKTICINSLGDGPVLIQLFIRGNPFKGNSYQTEPWREIITVLQREKRLAGLIVYGNPYVWDQLANCINPAISAGYSPGQMNQAQKEILLALLAPLENSKALNHENLNRFID